MDKAFKMKFLEILLLLLLLGSYFSFQLHYIKADTPASLTFVAGTYCDEGYKTLDARNMALFGKRHWSDGDEYTGWIKNSPVTVYVNFIMFKLFGVSLAVARTGNLFFALGCLLLLYLILRKIYDWQHALVGLILCTVNQVSFFYGRLALFEFKMMFFILLSIYFMLFAKRYPLFWLGAIISWVAAYYCKPTALLFVISFIIYILLTLKNGYLLNLFLRRRNLILCGVAFVSVFVGLEYLFLNHRAYYDNVYVFYRHFRSPAGAIVFWISQEFFTKNPILSFIAVMYSGFCILQIMGEGQYDKRDLFCMLWFFSGTAVFAFISFEQLGYYVYVIFPLITLVVRGIFSFSEILKSFFEEKRIWFKLLVFVFSLNLALIHLAFLSHWPVRGELGWNVQTVKYLGMISLATVSSLTLVYFILRKAEKFVNVLSRVPNWKYLVFFLALILGVQLVPISRWAMRPKYALAEIFQHIGGFKDGSIFVGDWAPQLCIDTRQRVLYLTMDRKLTRSQNFDNLNNIKPDYLVITKSINDHILQQFKLEYPGVAETRPRYQFQYAGRSIQLYKLNFRAFNSK